MKHMTILSVIVLMFSMIGFAQAQDYPVACGDLAEADCSILEQNQQAMLAAGSYAFDMTADFSLSNIPDMPGDVSFGITGSGAFAGENLASLMLPQDQMMAMMSDPEAYSDFMSSLLGAVDFELSLVLSLPEALVAESDGEVPSSIPLDIVLVDGTGYINFTTLREAVGEAGASFPEGWYGIDVVGLMEQAMAMSGGMGMTPMEGMDTDMMSQFADPEFINQFLQIERLEDTTAADGTAVAVFHTVIDYQALFSDPAFMDLMAQSMAAQGGSMSDDDMEEMMTMLPQMFQGMTADVTQTVGLEDFYSRSTQITFSFDMTSVMAVAAEMGDEVDMEGPAPVIGFSASVDLSDFNSVAEITVPEDATVIPLESLGLGDMSSAPAMAATVEVESVEMMPTPTPAS